jgi:hypothetical protein
MIKQNARNSTAILEITNFLAVALQPGSFFAGLVD